MPGPVTWERCSDYAILEREILFLQGKRNVRVYVRRSRWVRSGEGSKVVSMLCFVWFVCEWRVPVICRRKFAQGSDCFSTHGILLCLNVLCFCVFVVAPDGVVWIG